MNRITMKQMTRATTQQYTKRTTEHMHLIKYRVKELFLSADVMPMPDNLMTLITSKFLIYL